MISLSRRELVRDLFNLVAKDQGHTRQTLKGKNCAETVFLYWPDLTPISLENDLMAEWMYTKSLAPLLQTRLGSTATEYIRRS